jgi:adenine-specific DNA-methyltransferase
MMTYVTALPSVRDLGARGSRRELASADPAGAVSAATFAVLAAVPDWWAARAKEVGLSGDWLDVNYAVDAPTPAEVLDRESDQELQLDGLSAEQLGQTYVSSLDAGVRARHGRHYTPPDLSQHLWQLTRRDVGLPPQGSRLTFLVRDRACGAGALLIPPLREHVQASVRTHAALALAALPETIAGIELDPNAAWLANVILASEALPLLKAVSARQRKPLPALVTCGDGLVTGERAARVELQNPPYGRVRLSTTERERWAHVLYGHANLYGLFMAAAVEDLDEDGVLAALVPTSFTSGRYFENLRNYLSATARPLNVAFVAERSAFESVLQETCLVTFGRRKKRFTGVMAVNGHSQSVARVKVPTTKLPWLLPRRADDAAVAAAAATHPLRLVDLGYACSTGPLVWNRRAEDLAARATKENVKVVWAADIDNGKLHQDRARDSMRHLRLRPNGADAFMVRSSPAVLVQRTTAPEQTRRLVTAKLDEATLKTWGGRVVVENHVNVLYPVVETPLLDLDTLAAVLATETVDRVMRSLSGSVAVSAYEIEAVPFPSAEVLAEWTQLRGADLERAVSEAYRPKS